MAKRYRLYEVQSLSEYDLAQMSKYDLQRVLAPIRDAANKRVKRIQKNKLEAPALSALTKSGGKLSTKGKDKSGLIKEIKRGQAFLGMATSKIGGERGSRWYTEERKKKRHQAETSFGFKPKFDMSGFRSKEYGDMGKKAKSAYWDILHKIKQNGIQLQPEEYDEMNQLVRIVSVTKNFEDAFLNMIPAEAWDDVISKSALENDEAYRTGKRIKGGRQNYKAEKVTAMIQAYLKWLTDHPEKKK